MKSIIKASSFASLKTVLGYMVVILVSLITIRLISNRLYLSFRKQTPIISTTRTAIRMKMSLSRLSRRIKRSMIFRETEAEAKPLIKVM